MEWIATDSKDNATATATKEAVAGKRHVITGIVASFDGSATKTITIKKGTTTLVTYTIINNGQLNFINPLIGDLGGAVSAVLAASGTGGVTGTIYLLGYSTK